MSTTTNQPPHSPRDASTGNTAAGATAATTTKPTGLRPSKLQWLVLLTVLGADVMDLLDSTIVNVAAPSIARDLHASSSQLQWVIAGYTLAMAVALITSGRMGDLYGHRRMFLIGIGAFTAFSALSSAAGDPQLLIAARALQGLSAAIMLPQGLTIIRSVFPPAQAGAAMGIFGPVMGLAATLGPIVGGALVQANLFGSQWRSVFWVNLPLGLLAFAFAWRVVPRGRERSHGIDAPGPTLDVAGMLLSGLGMLLLVYPLIQGREKNWPASMFAMMAASAPVFSLFWLQQRGRQRHGRTPLVTPSVFAKRAFSGGLVYGTFFFAGMGALFLVLMLHIQLALGYSSLHAGLTGLPFSLGAAIGAGLGGGLLAPRYGRKVLHGGGVMMAAGIGGVAWTVDAAGRSLTTWDLVPAYGVCGLGMGLLITTFFATVVSAVDDEETGTAGGVLNAVQQLANSLGVALFGTLYFDSLRAGHSSVSATSSTLWFAGALVVLCLPLGFLLPRFARTDLEAH
ncbi:MAG TPA: MFS transporter [Actinocrinis sp.]|uniref:MFS transporter n=1 Tax=Actinocrinis sp. TaxID=1920516 RepID=UPI002DDD89FB|nr:MFS transporter [Actinocrinis sp.]HEV2342900.1 MFS transporter [Actinocrinis sp.]